MGVGALGGREGVGGWPWPMVPIALSWSLLSYCGPYWPLAGPICALFDPQHVIPSEPAPLLGQLLCQAVVLMLRQTNHKFVPHGNNRDNRDNGDNRDLKKGLWSSKRRGRIGPRPPWGPKNLYLRPPGAPWGPRPCPGRSIHIFSWCLDPQILKIHDPPHQKPIFSYF